MRHTSRRALAALVMTALATGAVQAQDDGGAEAVPSRLTLRECFDLTLRHNKDILAMRLGGEAARARILEARGRFDPLLFAEDRWSQSTDPAGTWPKDAVETRAGALASGVRKRFATGTGLDVFGSADYTDSNAAAGDIDPALATGLGVTLYQDLLRDFGLETNLYGVLNARDAWRLAQEGIRDLVSRTLFDVEWVYWTLYFAEADLKVREEQLGRAMRLVSVAEAQVRVGEAAPIEITRARSSAASQQVAIVSARSRIPLLRNRLLRQLGVFREEAVGRAVELADTPPDTGALPALGESLQAASVRRPDCQRAEIAKALAERQEAYSWNQRLPALRVYGGVALSGLDESFRGSRNDIGDADYQTWHAGIRLEVPLGNRAAEGAYRAACFERRRALVQWQAVREQALREVADAFEEVTTASAQLAASREARELAAALLLAEEKSFRIGRSSSLDVLDAQQALASAEREEVRARVTFATALSYLYIVRGDYLEAKGLPPETVAAAE
jgi:outer membrane protein TolC